MTDAERIARAQEWFDASKSRRTFALGELERRADDMSDPEATAYYYTADGMLDRMHFIKSLFPEITTPIQ